MQLTLDGNVAMAVERPNVEAAWRVALENFEKGILEVWVESLHADYEVISLIVDALMAFPDDEMKVTHQAFIAKLGVLWMELKVEEELEVGELLPEMKILWKKW